MSKSQDEIDELLELQRKAERKRTGADENQADQTAAESEEGDDGTGDPKPNLEEKMKEFSDTIESAVEEISNTAKEKPVLVSLVAFSLGLVLGLTISRR